MKLESFQQAHTASGRSNLNQRCSNFKKSVNIKE